MTCSMCETVESEAWIVVAVPSDGVAGAVCGSDCLIEYSAQVFAQELEDSDE